MRNDDLQHILADIERVAVAAEQLLRANRDGDSAGMTSGAAPRAHSAEQGNTRGLRSTIASAALDYQRSNPWRTIGIATGIGFLIGCMLSRRRRQRSQPK
jgi:ElaB/YqjD/DUF883 family membrane-anchored ribosome-binding protein